MYTQDQITRHRMKVGLRNHLEILRDGRYQITISPKEYHEIFGTDELNDSGITFDKDYQQEIDFDTK